MPDNFERCNRIVAISEGGANFNVINGKPVLKPQSRNDRGGPTNFGITWGTLSKAYSQGIVDHNDITRLTKEEANKIYKANYWLPSKADKMPWGLNLIHYDCAVNCGVGGAGKQLQSALNSLGANIIVDGIVGPATLRAIPMFGLGQLMDAYLKTREAFYRGFVEKDAGQGVFLKGWLNRLNRLRLEVELDG